MQKTRLGISVGLLGAAVYFMGLLGIVPLVILAGYVLLLENNEWLKRAAVKAVVIVVAFGLISVLIGTLSDVFDVLNVILGWLHVTFALDYPINIDTLLYSGFSVIEKVLLLVLGFSALSQGTVKAGPFDKIVNKNL